MNMNRLNGPKRFLLTVAALVALAAVTPWTIRTVQSQTFGFQTVPASQLFGMLVRGVGAGNATDGQTIGLVGNGRGDQSVVQGLPPDTELSRLGNSYQVITTTAATPLTATPTTVALISLWNGETPGGRSYIIDSVFWVKIIADVTTASGNTALWCMNNVSLPIAAPTTALTPKSLSGRRNYAGRGLFSVGTTVTNDGWYTVGSTLPNAAAVASTPWQTADVDVKGMFIVPPTGMFSCSLAELTATASKYQIGVRFHEVQLTLGF